MSTIQTGITEQVIAWLFDHLPTVYAVGAAVSISALMSLYDGRTLVQTVTGIAGVRRSCHGRGRVVALLRFS
ncbi:putative phage holin protein [Escherichia coli]|uniref:Phage holin protein n=1 Tax=Escherichia coli TaxID=562 RepID=A0AB38GRG5_ECOLX|nr:putative phage holin protein [Escherichia coli]